MHPTHHGRRLIAAPLVAAVLALGLCGCGSTVPAETQTPTARACDLAAQLAEVAPWPPPDDLGLAAAIESSDNADLRRALEVALASLTDHERIVSADFQGVAPTEARDILLVCESLG